jgi:hypothetical protein
MTEQEIWQLISVLAVDLDDFQFLLQKKPLLAHYTSINVLEKIMKSDEIWFSNPLVMNDLEEVRFGVLEGMRLFQLSEAVNRACQTPDRTNLLKHAFNHFYQQFNEQHAFDTYVFCLSEHDPKNTDGLLSMWRGYGGQGSGAALVFNTSFIEAPDESSPLILARVHYASAEDRRAWLDSKITQWAEILEKSAIPDDKLYVAAYHLFNLIKFFALKSKHDGFKEEQEWRLIYMPERDTQGVGKERFKFDYLMTNRGVEPKMRFTIKPLDPSQTWTFATILDRIILGPSLSSWLARRGVERMLETVGKPEFREKIATSRIPLRPT